VDIIAKEWVNKSEMEKTVKKLDKKVAETKSAVDDLIKRGYLRKFWSKKKKSWMFQTTQKGKKWMKSQNVNINDIPEKFPIKIEGEKNG